MGIGGDAGTLTSAAASSLQGGMMTKRYWRRKRSIAVGIVLAALGGAGLVFMFLFAGPTSLKM